MTEDKKTLFVRVPQELRKQFHLRCVAKGSNMTQEILRLIREFVKESK